MFDRHLSLSIDAIHNELDRLSYLRGWRVWLRGAYLRWKLRRLERMLP
jgi:hypothetical protein